jgi:hypothetical protein
MQIRSRQNPTQAVVIATLALSTAAGMSGYSSHAVWFDDNFLPVLPKILSVVPEN